MTAFDNPLFQTLLQRRMAQGNPVPPSPPPSPPKRVPPAYERWVNAQHIQQAYANGWTPNPTLLRAELSK